VAGSSGLSCSCSCSSGRRLEARDRKWVGLDGGLSGQACCWDDSVQSDGVSQHVLKWLQDVVLLTMVVLWRWLVAR
jgi:hypothetical protein